MKCETRKPILCLLADQQHTRVACRELSSKLPEIEANLQF